MFASYFGHSNPSYFLEYLVKTEEDIINKVVINVNNSLIDLRRDSEKRKLPKKIRSNNQH